VPQTQREVAAWLKKLRGKRTQTEVAAAAGTNERNVKRWENQGHQTILGLLRYLQALGVTIDPAPPLPAPAGDELLRRLETVVARIEAALDDQQAPPAVPRSIEGEK
jgi:transcriptional regulator with XRE-family HTH domain